ncbi:hypothetical protein RclHR1_11190005 [Rhizophagus clarus]|uniref:PH domain-containing protein n=1 Tax=Rhizophagus clarus TaxID=94130 RepID=A0A2Z6Q870_9GLOM|nr:hypothetical protein RclHR1_11190005 [Rhizophagus clarus]GES80125.1 hypothetical protein GLOIN_2v1465458 [Rhizophagus clarus]
MNDQLELMFDLLQQEVEKLTADLAREDSDDLLHSNNIKLDVIPENDSPSEINTYSLKSEIERSLKKERSFNSITSDSNSPSKPPTISSNSHQRSASHNEMRNLDSTSLHQKSISVDTRYMKSESHNNNYLYPHNISSSTQLSPGNLSNYQRIRTLSDASNIGDVAMPILSPMLSPGTILVISSDSDSDVSESSSDDTSGSDNDSDYSSFMSASSNMLRNQLSLNDLSNIKNSSVDDKKPIVSNESSSPTSSPTSSHGSTIKKKIKRTPTTGRGLSKSRITSVTETSTKSHYTDDENLPLRQAQDINLGKQREEKRSVIPRANPKAQESKHVGEVSSSTLYETDDENRPLRPAQNINLDKQKEEKPSVRTRTNSINSPVLTQRKRNSIDQARRRSGSKERTSDDHMETSRPLISKEHTEGSNSQERNSNDDKIFPINSGSLREPEHIHGRLESHEKESDDREDLGYKHRGENGERGRQMHSQDHEARTGVRSRVRGSEDKEQIKSKNKIEKENMNYERGERESSKNAELDNDHDRARSKARGEEERGRAKSRVRGEEERGRAKSRVREEERGRAKSRVREEEERGRAKSRVREEEERGRAKSRVREEEERGRAKSRVRGEEERGRAKSRVREEEERGRAKSRVREEEERGRAKSRVREEEERGRAKSRVREEEERGRAKSRVREEEERGSTKSKSNPKEPKSNIKTRENDRDLTRSRTRHRPEKVEAYVEKEEQKITEIKLTTQIFIENVRQYRTLSITSTRTALDILNYFRSNETISDSESWTLFEVINEYGLERPIRDWEYIATVIGNWEPDKQNALVLKKYINRSCLTLEGFKNAVPPMFGSLHLEVKKNKWQKRHFLIRDGAVYHCKDAKGNNETFLCSLASFDVYTFTKTVRKSPTKFIFALKSQDKVAMFENPDDYIRYLCADHLDKMKDWVLSLRAAKNNLSRAEYPERFEKTIKSDDKLNSEKSPTSENTSELNETNNKVSERRRSTNQWENLRKHVRNSRTLYSKLENNSLGLVVNPGLKKKESSNGIKDSLNNTEANGDQTFKEGSLLDFNEKNVSPKQAEPEGATFIKGSLLASSDALFDQAKEREKLRKAMGGVGIVRDPNSSTFVNMNNSVKFNQGSLLDRNNDTTIEYNNNSNNSPTGRLVQIENGVKFNKGSLLTKSNTQKTYKNPSGKLLKIDAPLSRSAVVQNVLSPNGKTLLEIDLKPDAAHTIALRNTNVKPLLSFVPGESNYNISRNLGFNNKNNEESETDSEYDSNE